FAAMSTKEVQKLPEWPETHRWLNKSNRIGTDGSIRWDQISLVDVAASLERLKLVRSQIVNLVRGVADARDTVHPFNEVQSGRRVGEKEAKVLLALADFMQSEL